MLIRDILREGEIFVPCGNEFYDKPTSWDMKKLEPFGGIKIEIGRRNLPLHLYLCGDGGLAIFPSKGRIKNHHGLKKFKVGTHTDYIPQHI